VDARGQDVIEIDERSSHRPGVGKLDSLNLLNRRAGVIDHGFSSSALRAQSIILAHFLTTFLDFLRFFLVHASEFIARIAKRMEHLV
jgi:hypothetical protein